MSQVKTRENTFKVILSNFPKRPTFEELHKFVHVNLALRPDQVIRLQFNHAQNCAHVKCSDLKLAQDTVTKHNEKHEIEINKTKVKVRLAMEDGSVEVKIHDLSENVTNDDIVAFLRNYGDVLSIRETIWGDKFAFRGVSSGIRVVKMVLRRHIKSFVTVKDELTLVTYTGQLATCRHCTLSQHIGMSCVENKKLLGQKSDLNARLNKSQHTTTSLADVVSGNTTITTVQIQSSPTQTSSVNINDISGNEAEMISGKNSSEIAIVLDEHDEDEHQLRNSRTEGTPQPKQLTRNDEDEEMEISLTTVNSTMDNIFKVPHPIRDPKTSPSFDTISESEGDLSAGSSASKTTRRRSGRPKKMKIRR